MSKLQEKLAQKQAARAASGQPTKADKLRKKLGLPDPFESTVQYTGDMEGDVEAETSAILQGFKDRAKQEAQRFEQATDTRFYCVLVFQTEDQKHEFLSAMKWLDHGDAYLDGLELAKRQGIKLEPITLRNRNTIRREDKKLAPLVMDESELPTLE